jgi:hypothetical protein
MLATSTTPRTPAPELVQAVTAASIDERVLEHPADPGRLGRHRGRDAGRQRVAQRLQALEHAASSPVHLGRIFEDDMDEGDAEVGDAADGTHAGRRNEGRDNRIGDLRLDQIGASTRPLGRDDDLHVREIRKGVERSLADGPEAPECQGRGTCQHQEPIGDTPADGSVNHARRRSRAISPDVVH